MVNYHLFYEIIGFDNSPIASESILPITTVGQQIDVIAQTAMELLVQQMEEQKKRAPKPLEKPIHKQIAPVLIRRNTAGLTCCYHILVEADIAGPFRYLLMNAVALRSVSRS